MTFSSSVIMKSAVRRANIGTSAERRLAVKCCLLLLVR